MKKILTIAVLLVATAQATPLYKGCAGCHGAKGEKPALGKSKIISKMAKKDIITALNGYKAGTYGGPMKGVMKGQAARLSASDVQTLANYIITLK